MRLGAIVLDSDNSEILSEFYQQLLGWKKIRQDDEWIIVSSYDGNSTPLVFQEVSHYERPIWPIEKEKQQQMIHLDFYVDKNEYEHEINHAISCGAQLSSIQLSDDWKVFFDPAGHPFCIIPLPDKLY